MQLWCGGSHNHVIHMTRRIFTNQSELELNLMKAVTNFEIYIKCKYLLTYFDFDKE